MSRWEGLWPAAASCELEPGDCPWSVHRHPRPPRLPAPSCPFWGHCCPDSPRVMLGSSVSSRSMSSSVPRRNVPRAAGAGAPSPWPAQRQHGALSLRCSQIRASLFSAHSKTGQRGPELNSPLREISLGPTQKPLGLPARPLPGAWLVQKPRPRPRPQTYLAWNGSLDPGEQPSRSDSPVRASLSPEESCPSLPLTLDEREPQDRQGHGGLGPPATAAGR